MGGQMYRYEDHKPFVLTDEGQRDFLRVRDAVKGLVAKSGAITSESIMFFSRSGDSWKALAMVDRLVEIGDLIEVPNPHSRAGQHRIFIPPYSC